MGSGTDGGHTIQTKPYLNYFNTDIKIALETILYIAVWVHEDTSFEDSLGSFLFTLHTNASLFI